MADGASVNQIVDLAVTNRADAIVLTPSADVSSRDASWQPVWVASIAVLRA
jgi:hypothetical protein